MQLRAAVITVPGVTVAVKWQWRNESKTALLELLLRVELLLLSRSCLLVFNFLQLNTLKSTTMTAVK